MAESATSGNVVVVSAPSGAGKTSLVRELRRTLSAVTVVVSHTTRDRRDGEVDGTNYHFIDSKRFHAMVAADEFVEHAEVFGNLYGTSRTEVKRVTQHNRHVILEIDWQGAAQIRASVRACRSIFILPPSLASLSDRLTGRGQDDADTIERRMAAARDEISHYADFDYLVVNDNFSDALKVLAAIIKGRGDNHRMQTQRPLRQDLIKELLTS